MEKVSSRAPILKDECFKLRCLFKQIFLEIQSTDTKADDKEVQALLLPLNAVKSEMIAALGLESNSYVGAVQSSSEVIPLPIHSQQNSNTAISNNILTNPTHSSSRDENLLGENYGKGDVRGENSQKKEHSQDEEVTANMEAKTIQNCDLGTVVEDEAAVIAAKAMEMFILEVGVRSSVWMDGAFGEELQVDVVKNIIRSIDAFDFLTLLPSSSLS